jgi:hypothetical protein
LKKPSVEAAFSMVVLSIRTLDLAYRVEGENCLWQFGRKSSLENWFSKMKFWVRRASGSLQEHQLTKLVFDHVVLGSQNVTAEGDRVLYPRPTKKLITR